jgi:hypothetical protein
LYCKNRHIIYIYLIYSIKLYKDMSGLLENSICSKWARLGSIPSINSIFAIISLSGFRIFYDKIRVAKCIAKHIEMYMQSAYWVDRVWLSAHAYAPHRTAFYNTDYQYSFILFLTFTANWFSIWYLKTINKIL